MIIPIGNNQLSLVNNHFKDRSGAGQDALDTQRLILFGISPQSRLIRQHGVEREMLTVTGLFYMRYPG
jgi:hypothetical protein